MVDAALGLVGGAIGSILNYYTNERTNQANIAMQESANQANRQLAAEQRAWDLDMWNRQNAYNDPSAQMSRLRGAGINPALAYAQGGMMNEAAPAQEAAGSRDVAPRIQPYYQDPLVAAQVANINADTQQKQSQTIYQNYLNRVEEALASSPLRHVVVRNDDGSESVEVVYGNARVEFARSELRAIGLDNQFNQATLNDLIYNLAVATGSDSFALSDASDVVASNLPGYAQARASFVGSQVVQDISGQLAQLSFEAAQADKAGRQAYAKWLEDNKDKPMVQFLLALQGFVQSLGISLPSIGGSSTTQGHYDNGRYQPRVTRSWFFGSHR